MNHFESAVQGCKQLLINFTHFICFAEESFNAVLASDGEAFVSKMNGAVPPLVSPVHG